MASFYFLWGQFSRSKYLTSENENNFEKNVWKWYLSASYGNMKVNVDELPGNVLLSPGLPQKEVLGRKISNFSLSNLINYFYDCLPIVIE